MDAEGPAWGRPVGRAVTVAFALASVALVGVTFVRLPPPAWPLVLPAVVYEALAAAFALLQTRGRAFAATPGEVVLPVASTWLYPLTALALAHPHRHHAHPVHHDPLGLGAAAVVAGLTVTLAAYAWLVWAIAALGRNFSILPEVRRLVTAGPYAWIRHPLYLGYAVLWLTAAVGSGRLPLILVALGSVVLFERRAAMEERKLARYEPAYAMYAARTWRLVPGLGRLAPPRATG